MEEHYEPLVFTRHNLKLHALVLERQAWFCARDLGRFLGMFFEERITKKLGADQRWHVLTTRTRCSNPIATTSILY